MIINREKRDFSMKKVTFNPPEEWIRVENAFPPIITLEEWNELYKIRVSRVNYYGCKKRGKKVSGYSFSGKIICGECGSTYWRKQKSKDWSQKYWTCSRKIKNGGKIRKKDYKWKNRRDIFCRFLKATSFLDFIQFMVSDELLPFQFFIVLWDNLTTWSIYSDFDIELRHFAITASLDMFYGTSILQTGITLWSVRGKNSEGNPGKLVHYRQQKLSVPYLWVASQRIAPSWYHPCRWKGMSGVTWKR